MPRVVPRQTTDASTSSMDVDTNPADDANATRFQLTYVQAAQATDMTEHAAETTAAPQLGFEVEEWDYAPPGFGCETCLSLTIHNGMTKRSSGVVKVSHELVSTGADGDQRQSTSFYIPSTSEGHQLINDLKEILRCVYMFA